MDNIISLYTDLEKLVDSAETIPVLENDPYRMNPAEFSEFYENLIKEHKMHTTEDSPSFEEPYCGESKDTKMETRKINRVGISITPLSSRVLNAENKDFAKYNMTIPKRPIIPASPVSAAFGDRNQDDVDDINKLLQQLS